MHGGEFGGELGARLAAQERRLRLLLNHLAGRALRARIEIDDLLQEVFVRVLSASDDLPLPAAYEGALWSRLALVARHVVIDAARALRTARRDGRHERLQRSDWSRSGADAMPASTAPGPHSAVLGRETSERLAQAFLALSPEHRRVLGLRQFEGLSAEETGRRLGRSTSAVHSLYRRALAAWQSELEKKRVPRDESETLLRLEEP